MINIKQTQNLFIRFNNKMTTLTDIYKYIKKCDKSEMNDLEILKTEITDDIFLFFLEILKTEITDDIYEILELIHINTTTLLKKDNVKKCIDNYMYQK